MFANHFSTGLRSLRAICSDPQIRVVTLPLIDRFYGPNGYPSLFDFPGCSTPNARQEIQAPGLLDCSALGREVQRCQAGGTKVLLSVKGDSLSAVSGNAQFGDPSVEPQPFGPYFAAEGGINTPPSKRQVEIEIKILDDNTVDGPSAPAPIAEPSEPIPYIPLGHGPVVINKTTPIQTGPEITSIPLQTPPAPSTPIIPVPISAPNATKPPFPNLFNRNHPARSLALTLFSLFGEGHTERADLRPLGPDVPSGASPPSLNGTNWINPTLTMLQRPLGEEVVVDGFDVQLPAEWKGTYQDKQFHGLVNRLKQLTRQAWKESGAKEGGRNDLGADGMGVVYFGWMGGSLKVRSPGLKVRASVQREGWREWNGGM